ncbi:MAG: siderophore ferric iron reductase [Devosia sp.]|uniref:siderophore ferric iron reductase n=1 Tax=Devosia sp. TaxID=1871048 RepID=UPI0024CD76BA|nr:siderophore ferric iron reductase [Devosia sp.]UYN99242.1 MAG: siderophore ferric iron reductase [Devosia sp.]
MTQRDYLFAGDNGDVALTRLIATLARATGFLKGAPGGPLPGWHLAGADNSAFLADWLARIRLAFPDAGEAYYAARLWNNLTWQPAYLAVLSVHLHGAVPDLTRLAQARQNFDVDGYRLPAGPQFRDDFPAMITHAGAGLRRVADALLDEVNDHVPLKPLPARRLLADRLLMIILRLPDYRPGTTMAEQHELASAWLEAAGLAGLGRLETVEVPGCEPVVILDRKGCCLDYLAMPDAYCASCPRQDRQTRIERQRDQALAEREMQNLHG